MGQNAQEPTGDQVGAHLLDQVRRCNYLPPSAAAAAAAASCAAFCARTAGCFMFAA